MPNIKPETKVLIIKNLKSKSPPEVADIFNVSKWQVERIRKRNHDALATSMTDPGRADCARQLLETTARGSDCQKPHIGFLLTMVSTVVLLPRNQR